jgi:hypothetical protein
MMKKYSLGIAALLATSFVLMGMTAIPSAHANPGMTASCNAANPSCTTVHMLPGQTLSIFYDIGWDSLVCSTSGGCNICVWASDGITDVAHGCGNPSPGNNGFVFNPSTAKSSTFAIAQGSSGTQTVSLSVTAPLASAIGGVTVNACLLQTGSSTACSTTAGTSSAISTQLVQAPEFATTVVLMGAIGFAGLALLKRKSLPVTA